MKDGLLTAMTAAARKAAEERAKNGGAHAVEREAATRQPRREAFRSALAGPGLCVIAECKRRSPSRGILRRVYDPAGIARSYERAGAAAISVLVEPTFFDGRLEHLRQVRAAVDLPLLRKDFVSIEFQVLEARAYGADAVLLIVAALSDSELSSLMAAAIAIGIAPLVEVHDLADLDRALSAGADIIGVNSRNLQTLSVSIETFDELADHLPRGGVSVAESGLKSGADLQRLRVLGYQAFLIGERFMSSDDPGRALAELLAAGQAGDSA